MDLLLFALGVVLAGLVIGGVARFAVPGPDPLPIWKTIALGVAGSFVGGFVGGIVLALAGQAPTDDAGGATTGFVLSVLGAVALLILYRRVVQNRPITGPDAHRPPRDGV